VVVKELAKKQSTSHKVQVAINWTASAEQLTPEALHNSYRIEDGGSEKLVLITLVSQGGHTASLSV